MQRLRDVMIAATLRTLARRVSWRRFRDDQRGNVLLLFAISLLPLTFATGMGIDYAQAMRLQTKLEVASDAAALAAVSKMAMGYSSDIGIYAAQQMFIAQTQGLIGTGGLVINYADPTQLAISVVNNTQNTSTQRLATVKFRALSKNSFAGVLGMNTLTIQGTSQSTASTAPNIDFYIMMDVSQSMLLPATSADLATMTNATSGCAFACHVTGSSSDNYSIARSNNLTLRTDLVATAVQDLTGTATRMAQNNNANYRMGLEDFDYAYRTIWPTTNVGGYWVDNNLSNVNNHVADASVATYCSNNYRVCGTLDNDTDSNFTTAMNGVNAIIPNPGTGVNGSTPEAVMFIITDGMRDELSGSSRIMGPIDTSLCTTIKNRGIRIAVLDTQYLPASASDSWSITNVRTPFLSPTDTITPALTNCATPGLFYQVTTNDNISAALAQLFQQAVATARLTH